MKIRSKILKHLFCVSASLILLAPAIVAIQLNNTKSDTAHALKVSSIFPAQGAMNGSTEFTIEGMFNGMVDIVQISAGSSHSLALDSNGKVYAWGDDYYGQLGDGDGIEEKQSSPVAVDTSGVLAGKTIVQIAAGGDHSLALDSDGQVYAWGSDEYGGQLGDGGINECDEKWGSRYCSSPVAVDTSGVLDGKEIVQISAGDEHSLALDSNGKVYAWGDDYAGQLGDGGYDEEDQYSPVAVDTSGVLAGKEIVQISAGAYHSFALDSDGQVYAWGGDYLGQLGDGVYDDDQYSPVAVDTSGVLAGKEIVQIVAGDWHSLALDSEGQVYAWGEDYRGQLGDGGTYTDQSSPVAVDTSGVLAGKEIVQISAGYEHSLALDSEGQVYAWGNNYDGQLGDGGTDTEQSSPVVVNTFGVLTGKTIMQISAGEYHSLALDSEGQVYAWGNNYDGQLGDGNECECEYGFQPLSLGLDFGLGGGDDTDECDESACYKSLPVPVGANPTAPEAPNTPTEDADDTEDTEDTEDTKATEATAPRVPNTGAK